MLFRFKQSAFLSSVIFCVIALKADAPAPVAKFHFEVSETKVLPGNSAEKGKGHNCRGTIGEEDQIGDFGIAAIFHQNACYTDANYSHKNYKVESGTAVSADGSQRFSAIRVYPPANQAAKFLASNHAAYYRTTETLDVYQLEAGMLAKVYRTIGAGALPGGYQKVDGFFVSRVDAVRTYVFIPASQNFSPYQKISEATEAARIFIDKNFSIDKYRIAVKGKIFDTVRDFTAGPEAHGSIYGQNRVFFATPRPDGITVIWQNRQNDEIYASRIASDFTTHNQMKLTSVAGHLLAAATADSSGNLYYTQIEKSRGSGMPTTKRVTAFKADADGKALKRANLDASAKGLNITGFGDNSLCSLAYSNGKLGLILSRTMHRASDGLNHQGAIAVLLDAGTLNVTRNLGQTSGHSFGNAMTIDSAQKFLAIDLGDNYPRGVHLHRFDENGREGKIVYTFKTEHGTQARSPAGRSYPVYSEISGGSKTFYQWSNDNHTYSEIGGVHEMENGIAVFFAGEPNSAGQSLDNASTGSNHNDARNLGMVFLKKDFNAENAVLSKGTDESGGFYSFGGTFSEQHNKGILWLTRYTDKANHNASRIKTAAIDGGRVLIAHEIWTSTGYSSTQLTILQAATGRVEKTVNLGPIMQLGWRDDLLVHEGKVLAISGNSTDGKLEVLAITIR